MQSLNRLALSILVVLSATLSSAAADAADSGLVVAVESWWVEPQNADLDYAFVGVGTLAGGGEIRTMSQNRESVPVFYAGWRLASSSTTELGLRLWEYEDGSVSATGDRPNDVGPLLASPAFLGLQKVDSAEANSRLRATSVDGGVTWTHQLGETATLRVDAGVRFFRYERKTNVTYRKLPREVFINSSGESRGAGPRAAVAYEHRYGKRYRVGASFGLAVPVGDVESRTLQEDTSGGSLNTATNVVQPESGRAFFHLESRLWFEAALRGGWRVTAAYVFQRWAGVEQTQRLVDVAAQAAAVPFEEDVVFEGLSVGLVYTF